MSQAVAAAVRAGERHRAERLLHEMMKAKHLGGLDTMPFNSVAQTNQKHLRHLRGGFFFSVGQEIVSGKPQFSCR